MTTENKNGVLSREIKLKKDKYPTKRTMNFVEDNESASNRKTIIIFVVFMIFLGLFTKFGVIDFLNKTNQLEADYNAGNTQIAELQEKLKDYSSVEEQYNSMVGSFLSDDEKYSLNRPEILKMVDEDILPVVSISGITINNENVSVYTGLTDLNTISKVVDIIEKDERTDYVTVSRTVADSNDTGLVSATIEITCKNDEGGAQ